MRTSSGRNRKCLQIHSWLGRVGFEAPKNSLGDCLLTDIIQTVLEALECYLSNNIYYMHILAILDRFVFSLLWARNSSNGGSILPILNWF
jgi:hypothetical protein